MRRAIGRYRAANDRPGPRRGFKGDRFKRRFLRGGLAGNAGGKARNGFDCGDVFVSLDNVPEEGLHAFFKGGGKGKSRRMCLKCGQSGHIAANCFSPHEPRFKCGKPGHRVASCNAAIVVLSSDSSCSICHYPVFTPVGPSGSRFQDGAPSAAP